MRRAASLLALAVVLATVPVTLSVPHVRSEIDAPTSGSSTPILRDGDMHMHGASAPLAKINETEVLQWHAPTPPSYWTIDLEASEGERRYPGLMVAHALFMCLAFFVSLPAGIALRSVKHAMHGVAVASFWSFIVLAVASATVYRKLTPNMYEHQVHSSHGWLVIIGATVLSTVDGLALLYRSGTYIRDVAAGRRRFSFRSLRIVALLGQDAEHNHESTSEYVSLDIVDNPELERPKKLGHHHVVFAADEADSTAEWVNANRPHLLRQDSGSDHTRYSEETLRDVATPIAQNFPRETLRGRIGKGIFATFERVLVFASFAQVIEGVAIYTGACRQNYLNGCLAHTIKGGIFWCYGLVSFARFLGSFSSLGWAWNRAPLGERYPTAEFTESFVIFLYGATNTWMERFGAHAGDPFTTKQIQHIGIAVMFWFAGLVGMGIESRRVRRWLASESNVVSDDVAPGNADIEQLGYSSSFNPFPALVIGITGAAMAAHHQTYQFQVDIHALWGNLLIGFSVMRCLTYALLWVSPPRSVLPSRPPTEALGSFFLACGGLAFISSTEEITLAAMRHGRDDVMMFLNVAVALTCLAFCWVLLVVTFKAWLQSTAHPMHSFRASPSLHLH